MKKMAEDNLKAVCSVSEMARRLGLSRTRFYQLLKLEVFPQPVYCPQTRRPFYPLELQRRCLEIRETGIGFKGKPFISNRKLKSRRPHKMWGKQSRELRSALKKMGLSVTEKAVERALSEIHPKGPSDSIDHGVILGGLFRRFKNNEIDG